jgi:hypothetical protein
MEVFQRIPYFLTGKMMKFESRSERVGHLGNSSIPPRLGGRALPGPAIEARKWTGCFSVIFGMSRNLMFVELCFS